MKKCLTMVAAWCVVALGLECLAAQQTPKPVIISDAAAEHIRNLDAVKKELRDYHDCTCTCGCYTRDLDAMADRAMVFLRQRAAHRKPNEKLALILDIDDTTLSTYPEMLGANFAYNQPYFHAWLESATAPAIPGTLRLYKEAQRLGVSVFFITGRKDPSERAATEQNLRARGFDNWQKLYMLPEEHGSETIGAFKEATRRQIAAQGYTLALNVGDQWSDLKGKPEAEFSVKYPDPFYFIP